MFAEVGEPAAVEKRLQCRDQFRQLARHVGEEIPVGLLRRRIARAGALHQHEVAAVQVAVEGVLLVLLTDTVEEAGDLTVLHRLLRQEGHVQQQFAQFLRGVAQVQVLFVALRTDEAAQFAAQFIVGLGQRRRPLLVGAGADGDLRQHLLAEPLRDVGAHLLAVDRPLVGQDERLAGESTVAPPLTAEGLHHVGDALHPRTGALGLPPQERREGLERTAAEGEFSRPFKQSDFDLGKSMRLGHNGLGLV